MRTKRNMKEGFTLVEVIVVLVILAILAAIMIPAMTGWIDKAKEKRLIVACRTCVNAAQTLVAETYGTTGQATAPGEGDVKLLAGVPGNASGITLAETAIATLTYQDGTDAVTYERLPTPHYTFNAGGAHSLGDKADMEAIDEVFDNVPDNKDGKTRLDSAAAAIPGTFAIDAAKKLLDDKGINLSALGAKAWLFKEHENGNLFVWTTCDITNLPAGTQIPVIRYRPTGPYAGQYTVWMTTVESGSMGIEDSNGDLIYKNVINNEGNQGTEKTKGLSAEDKMDLDKVLAVYNTIPLPTVP